MKKDFDWKKWLPYGVAIVLFIGFALMYCAPLLEGKVLQAGDVNSWKGAAQEVQEYRQSEGRQIWWTSRVFSGMPTYQISAHLPSDIVRHALEKIQRVGMTADYTAAGILFAYLCGFYILLLCFGVNPWVSIAGAFALTLSSYFILIIPAGHITKALAMSCLAPMIGGMYVIYRKRYWIGAPLVMLYGVIGFTLHPQMTYYMCMLMGVLLIAELYIHIREKRMKDWTIASVVLIGAMALMFSTKFSWWQMNNDYLKETMRGGHSELVDESESADSNGEKKAGLDLDYVTVWSYGRAETLTFLIPNYMGAASGYDLGENSQLETDLKKLGVPARSARGFAQGAPTYWGEKPFTSGPVYMGALVCLLFLIGLIIVPGPYKWALLIATLFSVTLAWGKHLMGWTELFYNYFPMYNKFRAVESILVVAEVTMPLLAMLGIKEMMQHEENREKHRLAIYISAGVMAGVCLIVALMSSSIDVTSSYDQQWKNQVGDKIYGLILDQRQAMMRADAWRSLLFVGLSAAVLLWYTMESKMKSRVKNMVLAASLLTLVVVDMVPVDRRFFSSRNFVSKKDEGRMFQMQPWEAQILEDTDPTYRVLNLSSNTFNDARTSYRLRSVGGYSAVKLRRYQDLIDAHISRNNFEVLNMLNTRYIVDRQGQVHENGEAYGNVWFVDSVRFVSSPNEESDALWNTNLKKTAVADKQYAHALDVSKPEFSLLMAYEEEFIRVEKYSPDRIVYTSQSERNRIAVFSEIYYPKDWHLYIDDVEYPLARVDYVLRAAVIPSGIHTIRMEFAPSALKTDRWCMALLIVLLLLSIGGLTYPLWRKKLSSKQP